MDLEGQQIMSLMTYNPRIFSVDGAHFGMAAFRDLALASAVLHPEGVIPLDDYSNAGWPGVLSAFATYMAVFPDDLRPFLGTRAKLYLCKKEMHATYLAAAKAKYPTASLCPVSSLKAEPDVRVVLDTSGLGSFVDIAGKGVDKSRWCWDLLIKVLGNPTHINIEFRRDHP
jgi:hypothetical protein